ncbi:dTDP-4-dehydrorhamnose reductase [Bacillus suaedaesalsae]|uniref:dTDP-4-dehydrorhamnose reductase n=1 Tax=Bacillus suaedaesalsae TaxID=2810349 RepID=A0ABS2DIB6_9BACI|nr:dTDP-4-dehydrorhamnose reductase [Bacillus suaedaesalsae]MBM6618242.1 dTDP-4-dehydrorhamnose reductase [Bacillus suaedaesalsae]
MEGNIIKKVLVTGAKGQLGSELVLVLKEFGYTVFSFGRDQLDITNEVEVFNQVTKVNPNIIIHCAAFTDVDGAESNPDLSFLVNGIGTRNIAIAAESIQAKLVYISTDYVFNGKSNTPYNEYSKTDPINIYGLSKLAGECFVRDFHSKYFIIRTSWVFGTNGKNFIKTMIELSKQQSQLMVVKDQIGCPTYTLDLAKSVIEIMESSKYGTYHVSNSGSCSWYELANELFNQLSINIELKSCGTKEFPRIANRPKYSVMDHLNLRINEFKLLPHWRDALKDFLKRNVYK